MTIENSRQPMEPRGTPRPGRERQKILIVDDRKENLVALRQVLREVDAEIIEATSGNQALTATLHHHFAVAVLDVMMPGMSGFELAGHLRGDDKTRMIPIVFVTASYPDEQHIFNGYEVGGVDYIVKPFSPEVLLGKIRIFLEIDGYRRELQQHRDHLEMLVAERTEKLNDRVRELEWLYGISRKTEEALRESEARYRELFVSNPHPMWVYDLDSLAFLAVNDAAISHYGYSREEFLAMTIKDIRPAEDVPRLLDNVARVADNFDHAGTWRHIRKDGSVIDVEISSHALLFDQRRAEMVLAHDVTERRRAEAALAESELRYRTLADSGQALIWTAGIDKQCDYFNQPWLDFTGRTLERELGDGWTQGVHPDDREQCFSIYSEAFDRRERFSMLYRLRRCDGEYRWLQDDGCPRFNSAGDFIGYIGHCLDITERKRAEEQTRSVEEQLRQAQKLETIGRLAGGVAHDFNNMLSIILGYGEAILQTLHHDDPLHNEIKEIVKAGERSAALTRQLLAFSRRQTLQPRVLDLNVVINNLEKMLHRLIGEDVELVLSLAKDLARVKADPGQIEQVIMNLAVNARDAMPQGGKLITETSNVILGERYSESHADVVPGRYVMLAVTDTGCGMDRQTLAQIFEPFFTTKEKEKGTGLGLSMVYGIVRQSGGYIWAYSEPGRGTTFKIYLPQTQALPEAKEEHYRVEKSGGNGRHILVVEDEDALRKLTETILARLDFHVTVAANGGEALQIVEKSGLKPDLVITDVVMPGMSGPALVERLRRKHPDLGVLYMSGYTDTAIVHHGILDPSTPFLQKPFTIQNLTAKVSEAMPGKAKDEAGGGPTKQDGPGAERDG
jgi:PAS domain S-box-containing protein